MPETISSIPSITQRLESALGGKSAVDRRIASYMLANLRELPFETSASLASLVGVSESSIGRFCRKIGCAHFKHLKRELQNDFGDSPWLRGERLQGFLSGNQQDAKGRSLEKTLAAMVEIYELQQSSDWAKAIQWLSTSKQVCVAGFQTERGVAVSMALMMQYIRPSVHIVDNGAGYFGDALLVDGPAMLIAFDARRYSRWTRLLCEKAQANGMPVILVTDAFCDWADKVADCVFRVRTELDLFWDSTAPMLMLANLLVNDVFIHLGPSAHERLEAVAALNQEFTGYTTALPG